MLDAIRKGLIESYKHRVLEEVSCVACGRAGVTFALHVIEFYHPDAVVTPTGLVPMSQSRGTTRGSVPLCDVCSVACRSCSLPIATPWTKRLMTALTARNQGVTFVFGNGACKHIHVVKDLLSVFRGVQLAGLPMGSEKKRPAAEQHEWSSQELAVYFRARPDDPTWAVVTPQNAEIIQQGFLRIWKQAELEKYRDTNDLTPEVVDLICDIANDVGHKDNLNPFFVILLAH